MYIYIYIYISIRFSLVKIHYAGACNYSTKRNNM